VTFEDGEYLNASLDDDQLYEDLDPYNSALNTIYEELDEEYQSSFSDMVCTLLPEPMEKVFASLKQENFGLTLTPDCELILKEF